MLKVIANRPFEDTLVVSVKELAESLKCDYLEAQGFIKFGEAAGFIKLCGVRKVEGKKGKPTNLYAVPSAVQLSFYEEMVTAA
jgi:hypothetical protein